MPSEHQTLELLIPESSFRSRASRGIWQQLLTTHRRTLVSLEQYFIGVVPTAESVHSPKHCSNVGIRAHTWNSHTTTLSVLFWESRVRLGWQSGIWKFGDAAEMETGLAAKGRDSQSPGSRFSGSLLDFRNEMGWCPCLLSLTNPLAQEKAQSSPGQPEERQTGLLLSFPQGMLNT